jgi:ribosomal protein S15P/S13E
MLWKIWSRCSSSGTTGRAFGRYFEKSTMTSGFEIHSLDAGSLDILITFLISRINHMSRISACMKKVHTRLGLAAQSSQTREIQGVK